MFVEEADAIETKERDLLLRRHGLEAYRARGPVFPESLSVLRGLLEQEFRRLAIDSPEFGKLMRPIVPAIHVYSVRLCDGSHLLPRAKVRLNLGGTFPDLNIIAGLHHLLTRELTLDLFSPPQRERIRADSARLAATGLKPKAISLQIAEKPSATAVQNALALHRHMLSLGLENPYVTVLEPPDDYPKLRRHKHERYRFQALPGYKRPTL